VRLVAVHHTRHFDADHGRPQHYLVLAVPLVLPLLGRNSCTYFTLFSLSFHVHISVGYFLFTIVTIRYDTIEEFNVDSNAEYSALSSTRSQIKKLKQTTPVPL